MLFFNVVADATAAPVIEPDDVVGVFVVRVVPIE